MGQQSMLFNLINDHFLVRFDQIKSNTSETWSLTLHQFRKCKESTILLICSRNLIILCILWIIKYPIGWIYLWIFILLLSAVNFQMCPQIACLNGCKVTLVAFVWLFSTVVFQMPPQSACMRGCIVTLVAFVWLLSSVCFHVRPQMTFLRWCIVAQAAFVGLFSSVFFHVCP